MLLPTARRRRPPSASPLLSLRRLLPLSLLVLLLLYSLWAVRLSQSAPRHPQPSHHTPSTLPLAAQTSSLGNDGCFRGAAAASTAAASHFAGVFPAEPPSELALIGELLDAEALTVSGWVYLAPPQTTDEVLSIQTIAASKNSGCEADAKHHGWALFANAWGTNSEQLYLSWGSGSSGCEELATPKGSLRPGRWAAVAATLSPAGGRVYVDGVLLADSRTGLGQARISDGAASPIKRPLQKEQPVHVGAHADATHPLRGYIAQLSVWREALTAEQVATLACMSPTGAASNVSTSAVVRTTLPPPAARLVFGNGGALATSMAGGGVSARGGERIAAERIARVGQGEVGTVSEPAEPRYRPPARDAAPVLPANPGWPLEWLPARRLHRGTPAEINASDALARERVKHVHAVFRRAWGAYREHAFGKDEIKPISNRTHDWLHLGATLVDCLDNLWLFGMKAEFEEAKEWVATKLTFGRARGISMFETVIRILGGLLSAYELSREGVFLGKAEELAEMMMYAFANNAHGIPCTTISLDGSRQCAFTQWSGGNAILAEYGTLQLEFKYLAHHTRRRRYWDVAEAPIRLLIGKSTPLGLYPTFISPRTGAWTTAKVTMGALSDSFYEYLVKQWLLTGRREPYLRQMFDEAMLAMARHMVQRSSPSGFVYVADYMGHGQLAHKMDHLACFAGAMLAVGAQDGGSYDAEYMTLADAIGETCYEMYRRTRSGLASEYVKFSIGGRDMVTPKNAAFNIGRPEAVETFYYMWYYTRDPKWREMGWEVFTAFERHVATRSGWASLPDVDNPRRRPDDKMESFVLAETMKYLLLLFDCNYPVPLEKYVINTEAHPLGIIEPMGNADAR